jgi:hypothetical protein
VAFWWRCLAAGFLVVGIVLSPLRAVAATIPVLIAYDVAVGTTTCLAVLRLASGTGLAFAENMAT